MIHEITNVLYQELLGKGSRLEKLKLIITIIALLIVVPFSFYDKHRQEKAREENLVYHKQMESLNSVEESIKDLIKFVEVQKQQLRESEDVIGRLKSEESKLRPVVEADSKVVSAILEAQENRNKNTAWKERGIGFSLGILASLIASILYTAAIKVLRQRGSVSKEEK